MRRTVSPMETVRRTLFSSPMAAFADMRCRQDSCGFLYLVWQKENIPLYIKVKRANILSLFFGFSMIKY